jgi:hypothetical protein
MQRQGKGWDLLLFLRIGQQDKISSHLYIYEMHRQGKLICIQQAVLITVSQSPNLRIMKRIQKPDAELRIIHEENMHIMTTYPIHLSL